MKYIHTIKTYYIKILSVSMYLFIYGSTYVHAQMLNKDTSAQGLKTAAQQATKNLKSKTLQQIVVDFITVASQYVLKILLALTVFVFMYGLMKYMFKGQGSDTARTEGRKLMLWGIIGIFVMTSVWSLVYLFTKIIGHTDIVIPQFK